MIYAEMLCARGGIRYVGYGCADTGLHRLDSSFLRYLVQSGDRTIQQGVVFGVMGTASNTTFAFSKRITFDVLA